MAPYGLLPRFFGSDDDDDENQDKLKALGDQAAEDKDNGGSGSSTVSKVFIVIGILLVVAVLVYGARAWARHRVQRKQAQTEQLGWGSGALGRGMGNNSPWQEIQRRLNGGSAPVPPPHPPAFKPYEEAQQQQQQQHLGAIPRTNTSNSNRMSGWATGINEQESVRSAENDEAMRLDLSRGDAPPSYEVATSHNTGTTSSGSSMGLVDPKPAHLHGERV